MNTVIVRPAHDEYNAYYETYVGRVPAGDILQILTEQYDQLVTLLYAVSEQAANGTFAPGEWSLKEVIGHLSDAERVFSYRALCIARGETAALPSFDQDVYVTAANFNECTLADLLAELSLLRQANMLAFEQYTNAISQQRGTANGADISVRALLYILAGHFIYHLEDISEKYLPALQG